MAKRLQLELSTTYNTLLEKLMPLCDLQTKKDVVENSLMLLGWAAAESSRGLKIAAVDEAGRVYKEIHTPALEGARSSHDRDTVLDPPAEADHSPSRSIRSKIGKKEIAA